MTQVQLACAQQELPESSRTGRTPPCPHCRPGGKPGFFTVDSGTWRFLCLLWAWACSSLLFCASYSQLLGQAPSQREEQVMRLQPPHLSLPAHPSHSSLPPVPWLLIPGFPSAWICSTSVQTWAVLGSPVPLPPSFLPSSSPPLHPVPLDLCPSPVVFQECVLQPTSRHPHSDVLLVPTMGVDTTGKDPRSWKKSENM